MSERGTGGRMVSVVTSVKVTACEPYDSDSIIKGIIDGAWRHKIARIRETYAVNSTGGGGDKGAKKAIAGLKQKLPAVMWAGHFEDRKKGGGKLLQHSGLLCLDLDDTGPDTRETVDKVRKHAAVYAAFQSPSGKGIKVIFRVPPRQEEHKHAWEAAVETTEKLTGLKVDQSTKNLSSLCYVSYDPDACFNPDAEELNVPKPTSAPLVVKCESTDELPQRKNIAERILGPTEWESGCEGFCKCPGIEMHTGINQPQDCRVCLDGAPTVHCFHSSCASKVDEVNYQLRSQIGMAESGDGNRRDKPTAMRFILPSIDSLSITESAEEIFKVIGRAKSLFNRAGLVVEKISDSSGSVTLRQVRPAAFRSRLEGYGFTVGTYRIAPDGERKFRKTPCPEDMAKALLESTPAVQYLPRINLLLNAPAITEINGKLTVLNTGYSEALGGVFIGAKTGAGLPQVPLDKAVASLNGLLDDFNFQTPSDRSRAIASLLTPAFRIGGLLKGHVPIDLAEADQSQSGKTYRHKLIAATYNEIPKIISLRRGGVGSLDESISQALLAGNPLISFDNIRGKFDSQTLESLLTCNGPFPARVPHRGEVAVDVSRLCFQMTSNGIDTTVDLANRSSFVRILKQPEGYPFTEYEEGDLLEHVKANQTHYLASIFAVIEFWYGEGKPRGNERRHDFKEWAQVMDWIAQEVFLGAPLMDGHCVAKKRATQPALIWLRQLAIALETDGSLSTPITASGIVEFCMEQEIELPSSGAIDDEDKAKMRVGAIFKKLFGNGDQITVEQYLVTRGERKEYREEKCDSYTVKEYTFQKQEEPHGGGSPMGSHGGPYNFQENGQCYLENKHTPHGTGGNAVGVNHSPDKKGQLALLGDDSPREAWENFQ